MLTRLTKEQLIIRCRNLEDMLFLLQTVSKDEANYCPQCEEAVEIQTVRTCRVCEGRVAKF